MMNCFLKFDTVLLKLNFKLKHVENEDWRRRVHDWAEHSVYMLNVDHNECRRISTCMHYIHELQF